jgi:hypothetical protein
MLLVGIFGLTFGSTYFSFGMSSIAAQGQPTCAAMLLIANSVKYHHLTNIFKNNILKI